MKIPSLVNDFADKFSKEIDNVPNVPDGFYDTFKYTTTGNNLTHPRTLGYIIKAVLELDNAANLDIDLRINVDGKKFQPDILVRDQMNKPILIVDYESPNSSDARIIQKDIISYIKCKTPIPYIIITTLPKKSSLQWKLLYTNKTGVNNHLYGLDRKKRTEIKDKIRKNPFDYWFDFYRKKLKDCGDKLDNIYFININSNEISFEDILK